MSDQPENYVIFNSFDKELDDNIEIKLSVYQRLLESSEQKKDMKVCEAAQNMIDTLTDIKQANSQEIEGKIMIETYLFDELFIKN